MLVHVATVAAAGHPGRLFDRLGSNSSEHDNAAASGDRSCGGKAKSDDVSRYTYGTREICGVLEAVGRQFETAE